MYVRILFLPRENSSKYFIWPSQNNSSFSLCFECDLSPVREESASNVGQDIAPIERAMNESLRVFIPHHFSILRIQEIQWEKLWICGNNVKKRIALSSDIQLFEGPFFWMLCRTYKFSHLQTLTIPDHGYWLFPSFIFPLIPLPRSCSMVLRDTYEKQYYEMKTITIAIYLLLHIFKAALVLFCVWT